MNFRIAGALLFTVMLSFASAAAADKKPSLRVAARVLAQETGATVRPFSTRDFGRERYIDARSVIINGKPEDAETALTRIRSKLPTGLVAFIGTQMSLADKAPEGIEIVVGHGTTQFDILRIAASDAINYNMQTEDLIARLQTWDATLGIDIFAAQTDLIELRLKSMPPDVLRFAKEVYAFCPDIVDQGTMTVEALAAEISKSSKVYLWWD